MHGFFRENGQSVLKLLTIFTFFFPMKQFVQQAPVMSLYSTAATAMCINLSFLQGLYLETSGLKNHQNIQCDEN